MAILRLVMEVKVVGASSRKRRRRAKDARARPPKPASPDDPRDTVYTSRLSFDPRDIAARERVLPAQEVATDWYDAFQGRVAVDPLDAGLNPDSMFCAGSMQHAPGAMFGNWRVENGVAVCDGPGPLGERFDQHAADVEPARLARLVADATDGIDVRRDFEEGYLARNDTDAVRFALPTVPNAGIVHDYPVVMDDYIRSGLISGKIICYGLLADLAGVGGMVGVCTWWHLTACWPTRHCTGTRTCLLVTRGTRKSVAGGVGLYEASCGCRCARRCGGCGACW